MMKSKNISIARQIRNAGALLHLVCEEPLRESHEANRRARRIGRQPLPPADVRCWGGVRQACVGPVTARRPGEGRKGERERGVGQARVSCTGFIVTMHWRCQFPYVIACRRPCTTPRAVCPSSAQALCGTRLRCSGPVSSPASALAAKLTWSCRAARCCS